MISTYLMIFGIILFTKTLLEAEKFWDSPTIDFGKLMVLRLNLMTAIFFFMGGFVIPT